MSTELDEVYLAHIKSMFPEFDDEIIWTAIFEYGYNPNGEYNTENTINYLLELSSNNQPKSTEIKITNDTQITNHLENEPKLSTDTDNLDSPSLLPAPDLYIGQPTSQVSRTLGNITNLFNSNNNQYRPLNDNNPNDSS